MCVAYSVSMEVLTVSHLFEVEFKILQEEQ